MAKGNELLAAGEKLRYAYLLLLSHRLRSGLARRDDLRNSLEQAELAHLAQYLDCPEPEATVALTAAASRAAMRRIIHSVAVDRNDSDLALAIEACDAGEHLQAASDSCSGIAPLGEWDRGVLRGARLEVASRALENLLPEEQLCLLSALHERSMWEFFSPSGEDFHRVVNLAFVNKLGAFTTPPEIAAFMSKRTIESLAGEVYPRLDDSKWMPNTCDPACGPGVFLLTAGIAMMELSARGPGHRGGFSDTTKRAIRKRIALERLHGADIDQKAVGICKLTLGAWAGLSWQALNELDIRTGNSLVRYETRKGSASADSVPFSRRYDATEGELLGPPVDWNASGNGQGFDAIIMNPPYGRMKVHRSDYTDKETKTRLTEEQIEHSYSKARSEAVAAASYYRTCGDYSISLSGELDWHRLFMERSLRLLRDGGHLSVIIPATFIADRNSAKLRKFMLEQCQVTGLYHFLETAKLFKTVGQATAILEARKGGRTKFIPLVHGCKGIEDVRRDPGYIPHAIIARLGPTHPIPILRGNGWRILAKIHRNPPLASSPEILNLRGELDLTEFRDLLRTEPKYAPLIRGDNVERFHLRPSIESRKSSYVDLEQFHRRISGSEKIAHYRFPRIVGRQCSYLQKRRRMSFALLAPNNVVANSCNYIVSRRRMANMGYLLGVLNSSLLEWRFRLTSSNNHVNNYELDELPLPDPGSASARDGISRLAMDLSSSYAKLPFGASSDPHLDGESEIDALVFQEFDLSPDEARFVLLDIGSRPGYVAQTLAAMRS